MKPLQCMALHVFQLNSQALCKTLPTFQGPYLCITYVRIVQKIDQYDETFFYFFNQNYETFLRCRSQISLLR
jgi:hypothetical protein